MISDFFIDRPIFASVISLAITLAGGIAAFTLPIAQYPEIAPPTVQVTCTYPGASAQTVADTVGAPLEQQVNGVERMLYMSSQSANDGSYNLTCTFDLGTNLNSALVLVQNRVQLAMPQLPESVQKQGVNIKKKSPNVLLCVNLISDGRYDDLYLSNYATIYVKDELMRLEGVGDINYLGERDYSIRAWLDPDQMATRGIAVNDVVNAVRGQNQPAAPGQVGQQPVPNGQDSQRVMDAVGRLVAPEQFGDMIVKVAQGGKYGQSPQIVRLRDVARLELGAQQYDQSCTLDGQPSVALTIYQLPGANALDTGELVKKKMDELKKRFPDGLDYKIAYDTTPFIEESVMDVVGTLRDAVILVAVVVLVFLQSWRAVLIPLVAMPVAIVGTFAAMAALGFSLNNISLFGLVLAIGIVVDDAIVVVENVERWLEQGLSPRDAARKAMSEVTGPVIAVALVLGAVFVPCAFIAGITGQFFRQFAVTIAVSTAFSALNSLTLSPALAALLLQGHGAKKDPIARTLDFTLGWFFRSFNRAFTAATSGYAWAVSGLLRTSVIVLVLYGGMMYVTYWSFNKVPKGFIPLQDQGWLLVNVQLPDSSSVQRTQEIMAKVEAIARKTPGVAHTLTVSGQSILLNANSSNFGSMFVILKPFAERKTRDLNGFMILFRLRDEYHEAIDGALVSVFPAPPVSGIGTAGGFKIEIEDTAYVGPEKLQTATDHLVKTGNESEGLTDCFTVYRSKTPQLYVDIDRPKSRALEVPLQDVFQTLQVFMGSLYVNNFNEFGRSWQVNLMAEGKFRNRPEFLNNFKVRNLRGAMAPLGTMIDVRDYNGPVLVTRYNMYFSAPINGSAKAGTSSGDVIETMDALAAKELPLSMKSEWTDLTFMQIRAGDDAMYIFALAVVFVFLLLAALYESWSLPLAVILVVPMCLLCSVAGVAAFPRMDVNVLTQIGFVVLVGLASKNAILIVEFARALRQEGKPVGEATTEACRLRLRPIVMTSFAFLFGVVPLVIGTGAGAEMRRALGVAVFSGMLGVTVFGIFLTPVFFYVIERLGERRELSAPPVRWGGSALMGGLIGLVLGFLLIHLRGVRPLLALPGGVMLGIVVGALVMRVHRRRQQQRSA